MKPNYQTKKHHNSCYKRFLSQRHNNFSSRDLQFIHQAIPSSGSAWQHIIDSKDFIAEKIRSHIRISLTQIKQMPLLSENLQQITPTTTILPRDPVSTNAISQNFAHCPPIPYQK